MAIRKVVLTEHMNDFITKLLRSPRNQSTTGMILEGPDLLEQSDTEQSVKLDALRHATSLGLMELEQGKYVEVSSNDLDQFFESLS